MLCLGQKVGGSPARFALLSAPLQFRWACYHINIHESVYFSFAAATYVFPALLSCPPRNGCGAKSSCGNSLSPAYTEHLVYSQKLCRCRYIRIDAPIVPTEGQYDYFPHSGYHCGDCALYNSGGIGGFASGNIYCSLVYGSNPAASTLPLSVNLLKSCRPYSYETFYML